MKRMGVTSRSGPPGHCHVHYQEPRAIRLVDPLTERELEVLHLVAAGMSNQLIADHLVISERTIRTHVGNVMSKLNALNRTDAVRIAAEMGVIEAGTVVIYGGGNKHRDGDTDPPTIIGYFWMLHPECAAPEPVQLASSVWGEWRIARMGGAWEPYLPHRLRMEGVRWWGPFLPPVTNEEDANPNLARRKYSRVTPEEAMEIRRLRNEGLTFKTIAKACRVSTATVANYAYRTEQETERKP